MPGLFSFEPFDYGTRQVADVCDKSGGIHKADALPVQLLSSDETWGDFENLLSQHGNIQETIDVTQKQDCFSPENDLQQPNQQHAFSVSDFGSLDDFIQFHFTSPPFQQAPEKSVDLHSTLTKLSDVMQPNASSTYDLLDPLHGYNGETLPVYQPCKTLNSYQRLSTEEIMRVAGAQYIQFSARKDDYNLNPLSHPLTSDYSSITGEETRDIELAYLLLASAEKIGNQQLDRGSKLLSQCAYLSSDTGNPVQRIAYYFSKALWERIDRETGRIPPKGVKGGRRRTSDADVEEAILSPNPVLLESHQKLPFSQMLQFPGVQAIVESLGSARKVHLIDLGIKNGICWTVLMQALVARQECPLESLKLTGVGTRNQRQLQATGKRLTSFAATMGLPFSFKIVMVANIEDVQKESFNLKADETVAVYSGFVLRTMITRSDRLDTLMRVVRSLNPRILLVKEVEGNHNSPSFFNRFIESLFYYSAFFDCVDACMDRTSQNRKILEAFYLGQPIMNIVATEGEERTFRHVGIEVWRAFFARFGMVEIEFSHSSRYQASLISKQFACGNSCTLDMNEKCIIIGWKGTPIHSLSAWRFY